MALARRGNQVPASRTDIIPQELVYVYVVLLSIAGKCLMTLYLTLHF
jgi:hypothetical protein